MAESLSHKFGQIIGDLLELALEPDLRGFAKKHNLYLDKKGKRAARKGKKVSWFDCNGNKHDLDFVMERDGSETKIGTPVAFIESAWRRYTKHSRNKAQEIQGAIVPLIEKYSKVHPFVGVVLAGEFTKESLTQLESLGFVVLYFPYETVIKAFEKYGINASSDENTSEDEFRAKIEKWEKLNVGNEIALELLRLNEMNLRTFLLALSTSIRRLIDKVIVIPYPPHQPHLTSAGIYQ